MQDSGLAPRGDRDAAAWLTLPRFAALLGLGILALYPGVVFGWRTFVFSDYGLFGYPLAHYVRESWLRGEVPLWNPLSNCGLPFLAQWNSMVFYPFSVFWIVLPLTWALPVFCLGHQFLAGLGMYVLAYSWTRHRLAAAVAGVVFAFNGLTMNCLIWPNNIAGLGWMPWIVWLACEAPKKGGIFLVTGALAGASQMLTGAPEMILFTWILAGIIFAGQLREERAERGLRIRRVAVLIGLVACLSAVQLLPFLDLLSHSHRSGGRAPTENSMPPTGWANFLVPYFRTYFGSGRNDGEIFRIPVFAAAGDVPGGNDQTNRDLSGANVLSLLEGPG